MGLTLSEARSNSMTKEEFKQKVRPKIEKLVSSVAQGREAELIESLVENALKLGRDGADIPDLKLFNRSLGEMRYAARLFSKYDDCKKVAVFGSARTRPDAGEYAAAREFARLIVEAGWMVITGGGDGIMGAAQEGAGAKNSFGLNIRLPFEQKPNATIAGDPKLVNFRYFFTRKLSFVKETHAVVLFPGGLGTMDEGFETLTLMQTGKASLVPLIMVDKPNGHYWETWRRFLDNDLLENGLISPGDFHLFTIRTDPREAVEEIEQFYSNFESYRWVKERMVIRMKHRLTREALAKLSTEFEDVLQGGHLNQCDELPEEKDDAHLSHLHRLVLVPHRNDFGRLRQFIDAVNLAEREK